MHRPTLKNFFKGSLLFLVLLETSKTLQINSLPNITLGHKKGGLACSY